MAKEDITHSCGHVVEHNLVGKMDARERKAEWLAQEICSKCWKIEVDAEEAKKPITASLYTNGLEFDDNGHMICELTLTGGTKIRKDEIQALGYRWWDLSGGVLNLLSTKAPQKAWIKKVGMDFEDPKASFAVIQAEVTTLTDEPIQNRLTTLDLEMAKKKRSEIQEKQAKVKTLGPKPQAPACHPKLLHEGSWNGKYYGKDGSRNYYVAGEKYEMSDEDYTECLSYRALVQEYDAKIGQL